MSILKQMLSSLAFILISVWLILVMLIYIFQARFVYFPDPKLLLSPADAGMDFEQILLNTSDKVSIHGWYIPRPDSLYTLIFLHGNAGNISHRLDSLRIFHQLGLSVVIIDYRGYGLSSGSPTEAGTYRDAEAVWDYLISEQQLSAQNIIIFGRSLGGGIATWLARKHPPAALILESTFTSIPDMASLMYPYLPIRWMGRIHYPNLERIDQIKCPILFIHSPEDKLVPYAFGRKLYERARPPKSFLTIQGGHNDGFLLSGSRYTDGIENFIRQHLAPTSSEAINM